VRAAPSTSRSCPRWIGTYDGERRPGGAGTFAMTQEEGDHAGGPTRILECEPPRRLVVEWIQEESENWRVELDLWPEGGRTVLRFVQSFPVGQDLTDMALGWHWYLDKLGAAIDRGVAPGNGDAFVAEPGPRYRPA
jgi:uncharacterized protein YndB with AHSA1/START domain